MLKRRVWYFYLKISNQISLRLMELHFPCAHVTVGFKSCLLCSLTIFHAIIFQELV